jgi:hypothetical protein
MDSISNIPVVDSGTTPAAVSSPPVQSTPTVTPSVSSIVVDQAPQSQSALDIFKSLNPVEILFGILGAAALYVVIDHYRYNTNFAKKDKLQIENKLDELEIKYSDLSSAIQSREQQQQSGAFL